MEYQNIYSEFKKAIPEGNKYYKEKETENLLDDSDGMHVVFGMVVVPYIKHIVCTNERAIIEKIFSFMEQMSLSGDVRIIEVLDFTILEHLADEGPDILNYYKQYMGANTLQHCEEVDKYFY